MIYELFGKTIELELKEMGMYVHDDGAVDYASIDMHKFMMIVGSTSEATLHEFLDFMINETARQLEPNQTPRNLAYPFLLQNPPPREFSEVEEFIRNLQAAATQIKAAFADQTPEQTPES